MPALNVNLDEQGVARLRLNRPEHHNALNRELVVVLTETLVELADDDSVRMIALSASGDTFCSGADLKWIKTIDQSAAAEIARLFQTLFECPHPVLASVNGSAYGGGAGLLCCCDIVIASTMAKFSFSEVRLGLVPATIAPYVIKALGRRRAQQLFLSGMTFTAQQALEFGLVHFVDYKNKLAEALAMESEQILKGAPGALRETKSILRKLDTPTQEISSITADLLATVVSKKEAQEGINAFLSKRKPGWRA